MQVTRPAAVVVLAAGAGTRMKSVVPKVLHKMCGRSLLGHAIAAARGLAFHYRVEGVLPAYVHGDPKRLR